jgi:hypothetical protein
MGNDMNNDEQIENDNNDNIDDILINQDDEQIEIQNNEVEDDKETITIEASMDTLYIKELSYDEQLPHIKNPILLLKETLTLELDSISRNKYYIKFNYDSLLNFNCFISFKVSKNKSKKNLSKLVNISPEKYELSYISNSNINTKIFKDLPKGKNVQFLDEKAFIDIDEFNKERKGDNKKEFDISIEMVPILDKNSDDFKNKNEIVFVNLCNLVVHNGHYEIKTMKQEFKSLGLWFNLYDVFDSSNNGICLICYNKKCNTIILPCKHSFACVLCANHIKQNEKRCPICKNEVDDVIIINLI